MAFGFFRRKKKENLCENEEYFFRMNSIQLIYRGFTVGEITYVPTEFTEYATRYEIVLNKFVGDSTDFEKIRLVADITVDALVPIYDGDVTFYWDKENKTFRTIPEGEGELVVEYNPFVKAFDNGELRIYKEYAEHNLSRKARSFAYRKTEQFYSWNYNDNSELPVLFEIPAVFKKTQVHGKYSLLNPDFYNLYGKLSLYCYVYYIFADLDEENFREKFDENLNRTLWKKEN